MYNANTPLHLDPFSGYVFDLHAIVLFGANISHLPGNKLLGAVKQGQNSNFKENNYLSAITMIQNYLMQILDPLSGYLTGYAYLNAIVLVIARAYRIYLETNWVQQKQGQKVTLNSST